jgi:hypothetical protein
VPCTGCGQNSAWLHSNYQRHVADEAVGGRPLCIDLTVRRLYRENPSCSKKTFAEQVDGLTAALCETAEAEEADGTAVELGQEALAIHRKTGHRLGQARTLMALAPVHRKTDGAAAELMGRQAWHIFSDIGVPETEVRETRPVTSPLPSPSVPFPT